jgi:uncharacterized protein YjcR
MFNNMEAIKTKAYTTKELAGLYGVSLKTLRKWLKPHQPSIGKKVSIYFTKKQVEIIFEKIGEP